MYAGIVLAAGESARMGSPKAFLPWAESTFAETIVSQLKAAGLQSVYVVVRPDALDRAKSLLEPMGAKVLTNADPQNEGPISSIRVALQGLPDDTWGLMVCLVDHPGIERGTYATLLQEAGDNPGQIVVPVCQEKIGHPIVLPAEVFPDLINLPVGRGADALLEDQAHRVLKVAVSDANVLRDINTPEDYETATGTPLEEPS